MEKAIIFYNGGYWKAYCPKCGPNSSVLAEPAPISPFCCENGEYICPICYPGYYRTVDKIVGGQRLRGFDLSAHATARSMALAKNEVYLVVFPENKTEIESVLACRNEYDPTTGQVKGKNWDGETITQLKRENKALGLA